MAEIFISYAEEDTDLARYLSKELWFAGYRSWMYEREGTAGFSYLREIDSALAGAQVMLVIISPASMRSQHVTNEVARAYEDHKPFIPVLYHVSHAEFQNARGDWRMALGTSITLPVPADGPALLVPRILKSLERLSIAREATGDWTTGSRPTGQVEQAAGAPAARPAVATPPSAISGQPIDAAAVRTSNRPGDRPPAGTLDPAPGGAGATPPSPFAALTTPAAGVAVDSGTLRRAASRIDEWIPLLALVLALWSGLSGLVYFAKWIPLVSRLPAADSFIAVVGFIVRIVLSAWVVQAALPVARHQTEERQPLLERLVVFGVVMCVMEVVYALRILFLGGIDIAGAFGSIASGLVDPRRHLLLGVLALVLARAAGLARESPAISSQNP